MIRITLLFFTFFGILTPSLSQTENLKIAVAANLLPPLRQIETLFEKETQESVTLIVASSGKLTAQIINGAPYDIFISADMKYPEKIFDEGQAQEKPQVLVRGKLYFWTADESISSIKKGLDGATAVAIAQPELAPYGFQTKVWLEKKGWWNTMQPKLVYAENVSQVNQYIATGAVDAAFTSNSAVHSEPLQGKGVWIAVSDSETLPHGIVLLRNSEASEQVVNQFLEFIISPIAQGVFQEFGYELP